MASSSRTLAAILTLALLLTGCGKKTADGGSNVTLRDLEVVDGTANDSMVDLDNATDADAVALNGAANTSETAVPASANVSVPAIPPAKPGPASAKSTKPRRAAPDSAAD